MLAHGSQQVAFVTLVVAIAFLAGTASAQDGSLQAMRDDVRGAPSGSAPPPVDPSRPERPRSSESPSMWNDDEGLGLDVVAAIGWGCVLGVSSPFWGPPAVLDDSLGVPAYFPRFPYDHVPGYLMFEEAILPRTPDEAMEGAWWEPLPTRPRRWSARFDMEYAEDFDSLTRIGGHLLASTSSRFELDTEAHYFEESLGSAGRDQLWLGDCNLSFRFAQGERAQFRTGLGVNWLNDETDTELGFNFTYGVDLFPCKPWVFSSSIDWGTLGSAELFRFRTTAGVIVHGLEVYAGYEYLDLDRTQVGALVGGVRIWF